MRRADTAVQLPRTDRRAAMLLLVLLACGGGGAAVLPPPRAMALSRLAGCYAVREREQLSGDSLAVEFPFFFGLDTTPVSRAGGPAYRLRLPRDDVARWATGWSWVPDSGGAELEIEAPGAGYQLHLRADSAGWHGVLTAWSEDQRAGYRLAGPRMPCPAGLEPTEG